MCAKNVMKFRLMTKGQKYFIILTIFICGLLFFANALAFNLISTSIFVKDIIAYASIAVATVLTIIILTILIRDKRKKSSALDEKTESNEVPRKVSPMIIIQKTSNSVETNAAGDKHQSTKQFPVEAAKVICPACRKEFNLPTFWGDLIVDFGPPKQSNITKNCPNCQTPIPLKRKRTSEDLWKE